MKDWGIDTSNAQVNPDVVKKNVEALFTKAIGGLVELLSPINAAARRMKAAMENPHLSLIDPITAAYLTPTLDLDIPEDYKPSGLAAIKLWRALPPPAREAFSEVRKATAFFGARVCTFVPQIEAALIGQLQSFNLETLPARMVNATAVYLAAEAKKVADQLVKDLNLDPTQNGWNDAFGGVQRRVLAAYQRGERSLMLELPAPGDDSGNATVGGRRLQAVALPVITIPTSIDLSQIKSALTLENLQYALGNVSSVIKEVQGFINLIIEGPSAAPKFVEALQTQLVPFMGPLQDVANKFLNPHILTIRGILSTAVNVSNAIVSVVTNTTKFAQQIDVLVEWAWEQAGVLFDSALAKAKGMPNFLGDIARMFNSSKNLLDNGLKKVESFVVDTIASFAPTLNSLAEKAADWLSKTVGPALAKARPVVLKLKAWLSTNEKKLEIVDAFMKIVMQFAEAVSRETMLGGGCLVKRAVFTAGSISAYRYPHDLTPSTVPPRFPPRPSYSPRPPPPVGPLHPVHWRGHLLGRGRGGQVRGGQGRHRRPAGQDRGDHRQVVHRGRRVGPRVRGAGRLGDRGRAPRGAQAVRGARGPRAPHG